MNKLKIFQNNYDLTAKQVSQKRSILAFLLFLCIVVASFCSAGGVGLANQKEIASSLLESSYINSLTNDVELYATDLCYETGVPVKAIKNSIKYDTIYELERSYVYSSLIPTEEYNENAFLANVLHLKDDIKQAIQTQLSNSDVEITAPISEGIEKLAVDISNYAKERVRFENEDLYIKVLQTSKVLTVALFAISVISGVLIIAKMLSIGNKKYRSLRYAINSFSGAALFNFINVTVFYLVNKSKHQIIHPSYLQGAVESYASNCIYNFVMISVFVLFVAVCVACVAWTMKRHNQ